MSHLNGSKYIDGLDGPHQRLNRRKRRGGDHSEELKGPQMAGIPDNVLKSESICSAWGEHKSGSQPERTKSVKCLYGLIEYK